MTKKVYLRFIEYVKQNLPTNFKLQIIRPKYDLHYKIIFNDICIGAITPIVICIFNDYININDTDDFNNLLNKITGKENL